MKKLFFTAVICLLANMCQPQEEVNCHWENGMEVYLENFYLGLPCESDCFDDPDYASLSVLLNNGDVAFAYNIMEAPNMGQLVSSTFNWYVTAGTNRCTEATQQARWTCNQDSNLMQSGFPCHFYEAPELKTFSPYDAKYQFELIIETRLGKIITWETVLPTPCTIGGAFTFTLKNDRETPLKPKVIDKYKEPSRIYINNRFVE